MERKMLISALISGVIGAIISAICFNLVYIAGVSFTEFSQALIGGSIAGFVAAFCGYIAAARKYKEE